MDESAATAGQSAPRVGAARPSAGLQPLSPWLQLMLEEIARKRAACEPESGDAAERARGPGTPGR